jgi:hypothetical protein
MQVKSKYGLELNFEGGSIRGFAIAIEQNLRNLGLARSFNGCTNGFRSRANLVAGNQVSSPRVRSRIATKRIIICYILNNLATSTTQHCALVKHFTVQEPVRLYQIYLLSTLALHNSH